MEQHIFPRFDNHFFFLDCIDLTNKQSFVSIITYLVCVCDFNDFFELFNAIRTERLKM
jgi:hypothetical protein